MEEKLTAIRQYVENHVREEISFIVGKNGDNIILVYNNGETMAWSFQFFQGLNEIAEIDYCKYSQTEIRICFKEKIL